MIAVTTVDIVWCGPVDRGNPQEEVEKANVNVFRNPYFYILLL